MLLDSLVKLTSIKRLQKREINQEIPQISLKRLILVQKMTTEIESKTPSIIGLVTKTIFNTKVTEIENKKTNVSNLQNQLQNSTDLASLVTKNDIKTAFDYLVGNFK